MRSFWCTLVVVLGVTGCYGGIFDFSEFDDPFSGVVNVKNSLVRQTFGTCRVGTDGGANWEGKCLSRPECSLTGGTAHGRGSCLLGVCCTYERKSCGKRTNKRISYFENPATEDSNCEFSVDVENDNICQMRVDLEEMVLAPATQRTGTTAAYLCHDDAFHVVSPRVYWTPTICGFNTGQHFYVPVNASAGERSLKMRITLAPRDGTGAAGLPNPSWRIKITQLECPTFRNKNMLRLRDDSFILAPPGCLQYFAARRGSVMNFGFNPAMAVAMNNYIGGHDYAVCFRKSPEICGVRLTQVQFSMSGPTNAPCDPAGDYLFIPEAGSTDANFPADTNRFCTNMIGTGVQVLTTPPGPLYFRWKTDTISGAATENGFQFSFDIPPPDLCDG